MHGFLYNCGDSVIFFSSLHVKVIWLMKQPHIHILDTVVNFLKAILGSMKSGLCGLFYIQLCTALCTLFFPTVKIWQQFIFIKIL